MVPQKEELQRVVGLFNADVCSDLLLQSEGGDGRRAAAHVLMSAGREPSCTHIAPWFPV